MMTDVIGRWLAAGLVGCGGVRPDDRSGSVDPSGHTRMDARRWWRCQPGRAGPAGEVMATTPTELARAVERYAERGLRVAVEAGNQTAWIVDLLREFGAKVYVVHP
jgi:hypothetical protein